MALKRLVVFWALALILFAGHNVRAESDYAPAPRRSPRTPVSREALADRGKATAPPSRNLTGSVTIVDSERLRLGDVEVRLFGIVPPHLSAPFGPQARAVLDGLTSAGAVNCVIRDRDREGHYLATCRNVAGADLAVELLRRGLAVSARGTLRPTELSEPYLAAEQAAQNQRLGLWSVNLPPAASETSIREAAARNEAAAVAKAPPALDPAAIPPLVEKPAQPVAPEAKAEAKPSPLPDPVPPANAEKGETPNKTIKVEDPIKAAAAVPVTDQVLPYLIPIEETKAPVKAVAEMGFFERYQLLITGLLMLFTALSVTAAVFFQRWREKQEELRSIAAALRGELMAARAICQARLNTILAEKGKKSASWPRIRTLVFQAYVGRIGMLGSLLARQIASIYGQASDYAAYYTATQGTGNAKAETVSKQQALRTLVGHIEEVLPKLANIEEEAPLSFLPRLPALSAPMTAFPAPRPMLAKTDEESKANGSAEEAKTEETPTEALAPKASSPDGKSVPLWDTLRRLATERLERKPKGPSMEDHIPDYTTLSEEEELEAMAYGGDLDDLDMLLPEKKTARGR